jgi:DNA-binding protein HU-beta
MNKGDMITLVSAKAGVSKRETKEVVEALIELVGDVLQEGETLQIAGFGTFRVSERGARQGRNPKTGETIEIAASRSPAFKAGKALKDKVNS